MKISILGEKINVIHVVILVIIGIAIGSITLCSCSGIEGFTPDVLRGADIKEVVNDTLVPFLQKSNFLPECCPSAYSNSMGCLCDGSETDMIKDH